MSPAMRVPLEARRGKKIDSLQEPQERSSLLTRGRCLSCRAVRESHGAVTSPSASGNYCPQDRKDQGSAADGGEGRECRGEVRVPLPSPCTLPSPGGFCHSPLDPSLFSLHTL